MERRGVSLSARGRIPAATPEGFTEVYIKGSLDDMATINTTYRQRRTNFIKRHLKSKAALWDSEGNPTRKHLALVAWAYSPTVPKLRRYIKKAGLKNRSFSPYLGRM
jgi:hypothetical protein